MIISPRTPFAKDLMIVHDLAIYHTNIHLDTEDKEALFALKMIADVYAKMGTEKSYGRFQYENLLVE